MKSRFQNELLSDLNKSKNMLNNKQRTEKKYYHSSLFFFLGLALAITIHLLKDGRNIDKAIVNFMYGQDEREPKPCGSIAIKYGYFKKGNEQSSCTQTRDALYNDQHYNCSDLLDKVCQNKEINPYLLVISVLSLFAGLVLGSHKKLISFSLNESELFDLESLIEKYSLDVYKRNIFHNDDSINAHLRNKHISERALIGIITELTNMYSWSLVSDLEDPQYSRSLATFFSSVNSLKKEILNTDKNRSMFSYR